MGHTYELDKTSLKKIDALLPRLKYSVHPTKIITWLENFEKDEVDIAIDLLSVYEYIPFNEFMFRLNDLLTEILLLIPKEDKIIIFPYGKVGKSGTLVTYPLRNTLAYKKRKDNIKLTHDFENIELPSEYKHIIFLDDFIGSGKTFVKEFKKSDYVQKWISDNKIIDVYILATIIMDQGEKYILKHFPQIKIFAEKRHKIFDRINSPLTLLDNFPDFEIVCKKYGETIRVGRFPAFAPYGFDGCESLVSYFHCTPNNTLPIIWGKNKNWFPLFARDSKIRMDEAREFKKDIAFFIGICNRLGIDIYTGKSIIENKQDKNIRIPKHNSKQDHSVIALLFLKNEGRDDIIICHLLGITIAELKLIYTESKKLGFTDKLRNITVKGRNFLLELTKKTRKENFRNDSERNLTERKVLYLPQMFEGKI